jgi:hypothetical protein
MEVRPFIKEHGYVIFNVTNNSRIGHQKDLSFIDQLEVDHCFTGVKNSQPIVCGGVIKYWEGCYEGWVIASQYINHHPYETAKAIKQYTELLIKKHDIHRLQTAVLHNFEEGHRFAKFLGMKPEGLMRKYDYMEQDYMRYARVS